MRSQALKLHLPLAVALLLSGCSDTGFSPLSSEDEALRAAYFQETGDPVMAQTALDRALTIAPDSAERLRLLKAMAKAEALSGASGHAYSSSRETTAIEQAALMGDRSSLLRLIRLQKTGQIKPTHPDALLPLYRKLAETGSDEAALLLADLSLDTKGTDGEDGALRWWTLAAARGSKPAARKLAMHAALSGQDKVALDWAARAQDGERADHAFRFARGFLDGSKELPRNTARGLHWLNLAMDLKAPKADRYAAALARQLYRSGAVITANQLVRSLERHDGSLADETRAAAALALFKGEETHANASLALTVLAPALEGGSDRARHVLYAAYKLDLDPKSDKRVLGAMRKLAANGDERARKLLDPTTRRQLARRSEDREARRAHARTRQISPVAALREKLTSTMAQGGDVTGVETELTRLAEQGNAEAMLALADAYGARAMIEPATGAKSVAWLTRAAQNSSAAQYRLGVLYADGLGVPQDIAKGRMLLEKAKAGGNPLAEDALRRLPLP
jgi:TPR repeat protein